ncbi:MAG: hypothetical protein JXA20_02825 [Spirochaetes bacterium]|nr:hypothetical protein [Spirochaetota bacterium]
MIRFLISLTIFGVTAAFSAIAASTVVSFLFEARVRAAGEYRPGVKSMSATLQVTKVRRNVTGHSHDYSMAEMLK